MRVAMWEVILPWFFNRLTVFVLVAKPFPLPSAATTVVTLPKRSPVVLPIALSPSVVMVFVILMKTVSFALMIVLLVLPLKLVVTPCARMMRMLVLVPLTVL